MKLALGTAQIGLNYGIANKNGRLHKEEAKKLLVLAKGNGIDTLDTAIAYGQSESVLGEVGVAGWRVISKLPAVPDGCKNIEAWVFQQVEQSLYRLGIKQLYGLLLHNPRQLLHAEGAALYSALNKIKAAGYTQKIGASIYLDVNTSHILNQYRLDLIQAPFSIFDQRLLKTGLAERLHRQGIEIHTRSAFLQGLLLMPAKDRPDKFNPWNAHWQEWDRWLTLHNLTPLEACMQYIHSFEWIDRVVVGVDLPVHLTEILNAASSPLPVLPDFAPILDERLINPASWSQF